MLILRGLIIGWCFFMHSFKYLLSNKYKQGKQNTILRIKEFIILWVRQKRQHIYKGGFNLSNEAVSLLQSHLQNVARIIFFCHRIRLSAYLKPLVAHSAEQARSCESPFHLTRSFLPTCPC